MNNLLLTCFSSPQLLVNYLQTDVNELTEEADKLLPHNPIPDYLLPWAKLMHCNEIPLDKIYILFYASLCKISIPNLSRSDRAFVQSLQKSAVERNLLPSLEGNMKLQEGYDKLATFYASEFSKNFHKYYDSSILFQ